MMRAKNVLAVGLIVTTGAGLVACSSGEDDTAGHGTADIDPVRDDPSVAAMSAATVLFTWTPADQANALDLSSSQIAEKFTGDAARRLSDATGSLADKLTPDEWDSWASADATVRAVVPDTTVKNQDESAATVIATVDQTLHYPDGADSPWASTTVTFDMKPSNGAWKVTDFHDLTN